MSNAVNLSTKEDVFQLLGLGQQGPLPATLAREQEKLKESVGTSFDHLGKALLSFGFSFGEFLSKNCTPEGKELISSNRFHDFKAEHIMSESMSRAHELSKEYFSRFPKIDFALHISNILCVGLTDMSDEESIIWEDLLDEEFESMQSMRFNAFFKRKFTISEANSLMYKPAPGSKIRSFAAQMISKKCGKFMTRGGAHSQCALFTKRRELSGKLSDQARVKKAIDVGSLLPSKIKVFRFAVFCWWISVLTLEEGKSISDIDENECLAKYGDLLEEQKQMEIGLQSAQSAKIFQEFLDEEDAEKAKPGKKSSKKKSSSSSAAHPPEEVTLEPSPKSIDRGCKTHSSKVKVDPPSKRESVSIVDLNKHLSSDRRCAQRVLRWNLKDEDLGNIMAFDHRQYDGCTPAMLRLIRDCHHIHGVERLCRPDVVRDYGYSYPYIGRDGQPKTGIVFFAIKIVGGHSTEGLIHVGIDANEVIYHADFQPFDSKPLSAQNIAANLDEDAVETLEELRASVDLGSSELSDKTGWHVVGGGTLFFAGIRPGSIDLRVSELVTFSVYKLIGRSS